MNFLLSQIGRRCLLLAVSAAASYSTSCAHSATLADMRLDGLVATPRTLTVAELAALPHREQTTTDPASRSSLIL